MSKKVRLIKAESALLQKVFDHFNVIGNWPNARKIYIETRELGNLWDIASGLGSHIILVGQKYQEDSRVILTVEGIKLCRGSDNLLGTFVKVLRLAIESFLADPERPHISSSQSVEKFGLSDVQCRQMYELFNVERGLYAGMSSNPERTTFEIRLSLDILRFEKCNTIGEYIAVVQSEREKFEKAAVNIDYQPLYGMTAEKVTLNPSLKKNILTLIKDPNLKAIIAQDLDEIEKAFNAEAWKSVSLLSGSVCEGLLWDLISHAEIKGSPGNIPDKNSSLSALSEFAEKQGLINKRVRSSLDLVRYSRNLIHPVLAIDDGTVTSAMAKASYIALEVFWEAARDLGV